MIRRPPPSISVLASLAVATLAFAALGGVALADPTPFVFPSSTPEPSHQAQTARVQLLDALVFLIGAGLLGGTLVWWGRRIFASDAGPGDAGGRGAQEAEDPLAAESERDRIDGADRGDSR